ncbi:acetyl-CoA synthetase-like protein [Lojkania enalia]|uniref:Acetyl-CoA synthetase-like protein n=1 Tax=Lojkania enalia TaxID=147567 RepID=A0A9P4MXQ0_9PLEO|nr:acetyl-CoA synthetase-like protein [Didymosphaeria enalia]
MVEAGELQINVRFSRQARHQSAIQQWIQAYSNTIKRLVEELIVTAPIATPTDFPLMRLSDSDMATIERQYLPAISLSSTSDIEDILPCSPLQQGILLTQLQSPSTYCIQQTCRILSSDPTRPVSVERLIGAWHQVIARHSILRTVLLEPLPGQEKFVQIVLQQPNPSILSVDGIADGAVAEWLASQPILDLSDLRRPPHRLTVLTTTTGKVYCRLNISHTLVDASSVTLILRDLIGAYEGTLPAGGGSQYSAYVAFLEGRQPQDDLSYWKALLSTAEPCLLPPQEPPHGAEQARLEKVFTQIEDLTMLHHFRDKYGVSIASICQLAWALVLATWTGSPNVSFGNLSSGRDAPIPGVEELVGPMINMLVCHIQLDWSARVSDTARELQSQSVEAFDHQRTSLASIQHELGLSRSQPLFNSTLSYKRQALASSGPAAITVESLASEDPTEYDINVNIDVGATGLGLAVQYSTAALSSAAATRLTKSLVQAVRAVCKNADQPLGQLNLLSAEDGAQFRRWNSTMPPRLERCVHDLVLDQIAVQPAALAVSAWDGEMTYGEIDDASRRLAYHLVEQGVGPDVMVGMCMEKSKLGVVAMLAILRAGGAVVPLGVQHPLARIEGIVQDAASPLILVDCVHEQRLAALTAHTQLLVVDSFFEMAPATSAATPESAEPCTSVRPDHVAWVIYTSGSTGKPKGVVLQHGALATSILFHGRRLDIQSYDRLLQFAAFTFDAAIQEIITALSFGACTCIPSEEDRMDRLTAYLSEANVTIATLTSTVAALVRPQDTPTVRTMILMGEAVQAKVVDQWIEHADVINAYGPSECCIHSTCKKIQDSSVALNIGTAIAGGTWVVNPASIGQLVPLGAPGELLIEGPLLARGYLNDPAKTAAAFVMDPAFVQYLGLSAGRRMYRTGDLVRQNADGTLTYLGRIDAQIKIRGQRVETGEIEYHIGKQAGVHEAVALYMRQGPLAGRLIAAVVLGEASGETSTAGAVDRHQHATVQRIAEEQMESAKLRLLEAQHSLSEQVMHYMVPSVWIPLAAVPVNPSGKTDRLALTRWVQLLSPDEIAALTSTETNDMDESPATPVERQLRQIWSDVLGVPLRNVTYSANFFSLGGDSITAMQVVSTSRARGILLTVRKVLESQTIPKLAAQAQTGEDTDLEEAHVPEGAFALSPIQQMYFDDIAADGLRAEGEHRFNQGVSLHITRQIELAELARALNATVAKHAMLRARFRHSQENGWQQWVEKELAGSYRLRAHTAADAQSMQHTIAQSQASLDLEHGPVFAADLIERQDRQVLHLVAHHLVIDLVSWRILIRDLEELLVHHKLPNSSSLSFPVWLDRQRHSLSDTAPAGTLPVAVPTANWEYWGLTPRQDVWASLSSIQTKCDSTTTSLLFGSANAALKTEPVEILLAALFLSFRKVFADRPVPAVFTEGHGREAIDDEIDLSDTIGWFTTMTPLHVPLSLETDTQSAVHVLRQVKDQRRRIPGRGVPYFGSRFLTDRGREVFSGHSPAEVIFNYTGRFQQVEREDALFRFNNDNDNTSAASEVGCLVKIFAALDVSVTVEAGELQISVRFSRQARHQSAIQQWIQAYSNAVKNLVEELVTKAPIATATDFPLMRLSDSDMVTIERQYLPIIGLSSTSEIEDILPCSPLQQGILLTQLQSPSTYCIQQTCRILSSDPMRPVSVERLIGAWHQVIARHSILRTVLLEPLPGQEKFVQIVLEQPNTGILNVDGIADGAVAEWFAAQPILDLSDLRRPPHRLTVLTTTTGKVYCRLDVSHALVDASSLTLIIRDLISAYGGTLQAGGSQYSAYVAFLEGRQESQPHDDLSYWKALLSTAEPCLLPPQEPPHDAKQAQLAKVFARIQDLTMLHSFRDAYGVSMASICQLAWALVLATRTGSPNISFGNLSSGRDAPIPGVEELVGPMINMLVCHLQIDWSARVSDTARELQSQSVKAFEHQRTSLASLQHELGLSRSQPLFNSTLSYKRQAPTSSEPGTITVKSLAWEDPTEYDLNVGVDATPTGLEINIQYSTAVLSDTAATRLVESLVQSVRAVCENAERPLGQLRLLSPEDEAQFCKWNSIMPPRVERCIHDLVLGKMVTQPAALAISAWDGEMTYGELDGASHRLAHNLVECGVGPEVMVGLCMDKSKWAVVAMLAILRAGGAVVPLGVQHPVARIEGIVKDTAAPLVLVDRSHEQRLAALAARVPLLAVDSFFETSPAEWVGMPDPPSAEPCTSVRPEHVAWVIYTSGSTGKPKGVVLEHGALATSILAHGPVFGINSHDRLSQFAAYTFDVAIGEIMTTLSFGACICVPSENDRINRLTPFLAEAKVTIAALTSTVATLVQPPDTPTIRTMILIGEAVQAKVVDQWVEHASLINAYGPSECSIWTTGNDIPNRSEASNIGKPLAGGFWVVNPSNIGQLVPLGAPGELLIEGPLLARGYLNDPAKTTAAFVTDPAFVQHLGLSAGRRMYRTGDIVQQNADGSLTYLGRRDTQVKIRGQRVEIGEIEYHIGKQADVHDAVVLYMREGPLAGRLIASVVLSETSAVGRHQNAAVQRIPEEQEESAKLRLREVQQSLLEQVMHYMVPSVWIPLAAVPVNVSGKTDRLALTRWVQSLPPDEIAALTGVEEAEDVDELPATAVERQLRQVWSQVLGVPSSQIRHTSSFLSLGGDSVTAMQLVVACRALGLVVSVRAVIQSPTLAALALETREEAQRVGGGAEVPDGPFGLSPVQQLFFSDVAADGVRADGDFRFNQSVHLRLRRPVQRDELARALDAVVAKHAMLRARFQHTAAAGWQQWIEKELGGSYRFRAHQLPDRTALAAVTLASQSSLNLARGPVFAADLIETPGAQTLHMTAHHLVIDLVSWRILLRDLEELLVHRVLLSSYALSFPLSFPRWLEQQRLLANAAPAQSDPAPSLPYDVPAARWDYWGLNPGQYTAADLMDVRVEVDEATTGRLFGDANLPLRSEPVELMLAALFHSFARVFPDRAVPAVFVEGHGRISDEEGDDALAAETVGWFTTMTPLHVPCSEESPGLVDALRRTKDRRRAVPEHGMRYFRERFLRASAPNAFAHHRPMEVLFNYVGRFQQTEGTADGLFALDSEATVFDAGASTRVLAAIDVSISVDAGRMQIGLRFSKKARHRDALGRWAEEYRAALQRLATELAATEPTLTASDFPLARLDDADLESLNRTGLDDLGAKDWGDIQTILPATDAQRRFVFANTCKEQAHYEWIVFDGPGKLDASRFYRACSELVTQVESLRTIFKNIRGRLFQIMLRQSTPRVKVITAVPSLDQAFVDLRADALSRCVNIQEPMFEAALIIDENETKSRVALRPSHAMYDATSLPAILDAFATFYNGAQLSTPPIPFQEYVKDVLKYQDESLAIRYWRQILQKASMPRIGMLLPDGQLFRMRRTNTYEVEVPKASTQSIAFSSVVKAAWTLTLVRHSQSYDILFGEVVAGRSAVRSTVAGALGCCIALKPIRVHVRAGWGLLDLLQFVQDQQVGSVAYETLGEHNVLDVCTDLPSGTDFSSVLNYQRQQPAASLRLDDINFMGVRHNLSQLYGVTDIELYITESPGTLSFQMHIADRIPNEVAVDLLGTLSKL